MGKKQKAKAERRGEDQVAPEPISIQGWRIIGGGVALLLLGFMVLSRADSMGRNWASWFSPLLILGGYAVIAFGIFWPPAPPPPPASGS